MKKHLFMQYFLLTFRLLSIFFAIFYLHLIYLICKSPTYIFDKFNIRALPVPFVL